MTNDDFLMGSEGSGGTGVRGSTEPEEEGVGGKRQKSGEKRRKKGAKAKRRRERRKEGAKR